MGTVKKLAEEKAKVKLTDIVTDEALGLLAERLITPLQIEH